MVVTEQRRPTARRRTVQGRVSGESSGTTYRVGWLGVVVSAVLIYLILMPAFVLLLSSVKPNGFVTDAGLTLENYVEVYTDPYIYTTFGTTVVYAGLSTLVAVVFGAGLAWLVERTDIPGARVIRTAVLMGLAIPPFMLAIAYLLMFSPEIGLMNRLLGSFSSVVLDLYSLPGMIVVQGLGTVATVYLMVAPSFRGIDPGLEEAATMSGASPVRSLLTIVLPLVKPSLLSGAIVSLMIGFSSFDIPGVIGLKDNIYVFSTEMYDRIHSTIGLPQYGAVSALGVFLLLILLLMARLYRGQTRQSRRFITMTGKSGPVRKFRLGRARIPFLVGTWFFLTWYLILPTLMLAWTSLLPYLSTSVGDMWRRLTLKNYGRLLSDDRGLTSLGNSALLTIITPTAVVVIAGLVSWIVVRSRLRGRGLLDGLAFVPFAMPDVIIGVSVLITYLTLKFLPLYGTIWVIVIALTTTYVAYGTRVANTGFLQIHPELEEAAQVSGASWARTVRTITVRLAWPALLSVWIWVAAHALRTLSAPLFLQSGKNPTLSTLLWDFWALGLPTVTAAGGFLLIVTLMVAVGWWQVADRRSEKRRIR